MPEQVRNKSRAAEAPEIGYGKVGGRERAYKKPVEAPAIEYGKVIADKKTVRGDNQMTLTQQGFNRSAGERLTYYQEGYGDLMVTTQSNPNAFTGNTKSKTRHATRAETERFFSDAVSQNPELKTEIKKAEEAAMMRFMM